MSSFSERVNYFEQFGTVDNYFRKTTEQLPVTMYIQNCFCQAGTFLVFGEGFFPFIFWSAKKVPVRGYWYWCLPFTLLSFVFVLQWILLYGMFNPSLVQYCKVCLTNFFDQTRACVNQIYVMRNKSYTFCVCFFFFNVIVYLFGHWYKKTIYRQSKEDKTTTVMQGNLPTKRPRAVKNTFNLCDFDQTGFLCFGVPRHHPLAVTIEIPFTVFIPDYIFGKSFLFFLRRDTNLAVDVFFCKNVVVDNVFHCMV